MAEAYLDACCIIYMTEGAPAWRAAIEARLRALPQSGALVTSRISRLECRSKPMRDRDAVLLARFDAYASAMTGRLRRARGGSDCSDRWPVYCFENCPRQGRAERA